MMLFITHPLIDICMKRKISQLNQYVFLMRKKCVFCVENDPESFDLGFSAISHDLLHMPEPHS